MVIYLKHPIHGAKVAIMELEAEADEKNGWVRYTLDTPDFELAAPVNVLEVKRRRKVELEGV
jgi:hypothetical protein